MAAPAKSKSPAAPKETNVPSKPTAPTTNQDNPSSEPQPLGRDTFSRSFSRENTFEFSILTFNILADGLSGANNEKPTAKTFLNVPRQCLLWDNRKYEIVNEVVKNNPDIICMQEVDRIEFFNQELEKAGYVGHFKPKEWSPNEKIVDSKRKKKAEAKKNGQPLPPDNEYDAFWNTVVPDGTCVFWKQHMFDRIKFMDFPQTKEKCNVRNVLVGHKHATKDLRKKLEKAVKENKELCKNGQIDFVVLEKMFPEKDPFTAEKSCRMAREALGMAVTETTIDVNVFIDYLCQYVTPQVAGVVLRPKKRNDVHIVVLSFHLYSDKSGSGEQVRLEELKGLTRNEELRALLAQGNTSAFIVGDMNSSSLTEKKYEPYGYRYMVGPVEGDNKVAESDLNLDEFDMDDQNELTFRSAYRDWLHDGKREPDFSTWKYRMGKDNKLKEDKHTIDFLFYDPHLWKVIGCLQTPDEDEIKRGLPANTSPMPGERYPSDHLAMMAQFRYERHGHKNGNDDSDLATHGSSSSIIERQKQMIEQLMKQNQMLQESKGKLVNQLMDTIQIARRSQASANGPSPNLRQASADLPSTNPDMRTKRSMTEGHLDGLDSAIAVAATAPKSNGHKATNGKK